MSEAQARSVLRSCPALGDLDPRLAARRLKQLDTCMGIARGDAALLVLRRPYVLLPQASDVMEWSLSGRRVP